MSFIPQQPGGGEGAAWPGHRVTARWPRGQGEAHACGEDGQLGSPLPPTPAFWVNGGLTCLELSSDSLSASIAPISKEGARTQRALLLQVFQEHSIIGALGDGCCSIILLSRRLIEGESRSEGGEGRVGSLWRPQVPCQGLKRAFSCFLISANALLVDALEWLLGPLLEPSFSIFSLPPEHSFSLPSPRGVLYSLLPSHGSSLVASQMDRG